MKFTLMTLMFLSLNIYAQDVQVLAKKMVEQRSIRTGDPFEEVLKKLEYGSHEWGCFKNSKGNSYKTCEVILMPIGIYPENCKPEEYEKSKECRRDSWVPGSMVLFHINEHRVLEKISVEYKVILEP